MTMRVMFSSMLFQPFARAQVQNCGGKEHDCRDSKNGVDHEVDGTANCLGSAERGIRKLLERRTEATIVRNEVMDPTERELERQRM